MANLPGRLQAQLMFIRGQTIQIRRHGNDVRNEYHLQEIELSRR